MIRWLRQFYYHIRSFHYVKHNQYEDMSSGSFDKPMYCTSNIGELVTQEELNNK